MATLAPGININNGIITSDRPVLEDLKNKTISLDLLFNTNYSVDGTIMRFIAPFNLPVPVNGAKTTVTNNGCSISYDCVGGEDFDVPLDQWQDGGYVFATCPISMLSPDAIYGAFVSYIKNFRNNVLNFAIGVQEDSYNEATVTADGTIKDMTEDMIATLEANGYNRRDIVVRYNTKANSMYRKLGYSCCQLKSASDFDAENNPYGVSAVINVGNFQTSDIMVYVKPYALVGDYCRRDPEIYDGTEIYKGRSLMSGEMGYGAGIYDAENSGLKYTIPAETE